MFSALKKLTSKGPDGGGVGRPAVGQPTFNAMNSDLQRKFGRGGVHYNMKLVVKGDRNTGKTSLFQRLQGNPFKDEEYSPTDEIQVAHIQWSYKATDDIVKIEVWDVVDRGKKKPNRCSFSSSSTEANLKISNQDVLEREMEELTLDAELVDVYKGCHAVVFMMDVTKLWTFDYVKRELPKVPGSAPVLLMANFVDLGHHRQVTRDQVAGFVDETGREAIRWVESSMRNGFGLKLLHKFLDVPYLRLKRSILETQLEDNGRELEAARLEMELFLESDEADYDVFMEGVTKKRRSKAEDLAPAPTRSVVVGQPSNAVSKQLPPPPEEARSEREARVAKGLEAIAAVGRIDSFLGSNDDGVVEAAASVAVADSDSDEDGNPMVMTVKDDDDDLSDSDFERSKKPSVHRRGSSSVSSGGEEEPKKKEEVRPAQPNALLVVDDEGGFVEEAAKKKHKKGKRKRRSEERQRTDLEEFLNGTAVGEVAAGNYEEL